MKSYLFCFNEKNFELKDDECINFYNDEDLPVEGIGVSDVLGILSNSEVVDFNMEYYDQPCKNCKEGIKEKAKYFKYLEYHFYIFTKESSFVISNISKEYEGQSYNKLLKKKLVDNSYIVSVVVCVNCGEYSIEIEQCEI